MSTQTLERTDEVTDMELDSYTKIREWMDKQEQCNSTQAHHCSKVAVYRCHLRCGLAQDRLWCQKRMEYQLKCDQIHGVVACNKCGQDWHLCYKVTPIIK